jgi:ABC-2 type transport system permease protein
MRSLYVVIAVILAIRVGWQLMKVSKAKKDPQATQHPGKIESALAQKLFTVWTFFLINLKRLFRDRLALFFTFLFPLIFLFVFGSLSNNKAVSLHVALLDSSSTSSAKEFVKQIEHNQTLKVDTSITSINDANQSMSRGETDATIEIPSNFGEVKQGVPSGQVIVDYTENNEEAAQTLVSILQSVFQNINAKLVKTTTPFTVVSKSNNENSLSSFDYTFTGLLGFAILGAGIFGPMNIFPELKKMGILRRLHTTPLRVWQYFLSNMLGQAVTGLMSTGVMLLVAILVFKLKVVGSYLDLAVFLVFGIVLILGIGLALGGWAKNERQAAPLGNIIVFPMMFLSGVFFPRFLMPQWLQSITNYMPLTPVIDGARMILTEGKSIFDLGPQLAVMGVWLVIVYVIAFRVFRWE